MCYSCLDSWGSSINTVTYLQVGRPGFGAMKGFFSLCHRIRTDSGAHSAFYRKGNWGIAAGA